MSKKTKIGEEDILRYVLKKDSLREDKIRFLDENNSLFKEEVEFCAEIQECLNNAGLISGIAGQSDSLPVSLFPQCRKPEGEVKLRLAAASELKEAPRNSASFIDPDSKYLVRIVKNESSSFLYLFSNETVNREIKLRFFPSEKEYRITDISKPIEVANEEKIEKICIT